MWHSSFAFNFFSFSLRILCFLEVFFVFDFKEKNTRPPERKKEAKGKKGKKGKERKEKEERKERKEERKKKRSKITHPAFSSPLKLKCPREKKKGKKRKRKSKERAKKSTTLPRFFFLTLEEQKWIHFIQ